MRKKIKVGCLIITLIMFVGVMGCNEKDYDDVEITVSIAASLKEPMEKLKEQYEKQNDIKIIYNSGGSGALKKQIEEGAEVDLFLSANSKYVDELIKKDLIDSNYSGDLLENLLVLVKSSDSPEIHSFDDLLKSEKIALGEVSTVPAGQYAKEALINMNLWENLKDKIIFAKDVSIVKSYVERGDVQYGFIYKSDSLGMNNGKTVLEIPNQNHEKILYKYGIIEKSKNKSQCEDFMDFLNSPEAQKIFEEYGFKLCQ